MENYIFTMEDGVLYKNGVKVENNNDNKEKIDINSCPFCGSSNVECVKHPYGFHLKDEEYFCKCNDCGIESPEFESEKEAVEYWNKGIAKTAEDRQKVSNVQYDLDNFVMYCEHCGNVINDRVDKYCNFCGYKLKFNQEKDKQFVEDYDNKVTHPYGWPLTEKDIVYSIGKPLYINKHNGDFQWKVVNKIEINDNGYIIKFTDGSNHMFNDTIFYDPTKIVKNKLYPKVEKKEEKETISSIVVNGVSHSISCACNNYSPK